MHPTYASGKTFWASGLRTFESALNQVPTTHAQPVPCALLLQIIPGQQHRIPLTLAGMAGLDNTRNMNLTKWVLEGFIEKCHHLQETASPAVNNVVAP